MVSESAPPGNARPHIRIHSHEELIEILLGVDIADVLENAQLVAFHRGGAFGDVVHGWPWCEHKIDEWAGAGLSHAPLMHCGVTARSQ